MDLSRLSLLKKALASLDPFLNYLDGIVQLRERDSSHQELEAFFSRNLLQILKCVNGDIRWSDCDVGPRVLLGHIAESNCQFAVRQQQDAQELMEALINIVLHDARSVADLSSSFSVSLEHMHANTPDEILSAAIVSGNQTVKELDKSAGQTDFDVSDNPNQFELEGTQVFGQETSGRNWTCFSQTNIMPETGNRQNGEREGNFRESVFSAFGPALGKSLKPWFPAPAVPFSGWVGSVLRCNKCKYIRPIRNAPFLTIPLVPTSVLHHNASIQHQQSYTSTPTQSRLPFCSLEQCLSNFTNLENVTGVECPQCTVEEEIKELKDEQILLRDAIDSMEKRCRRQGETLTSHDALRRDLSRVEDRLSFLEMAYPDDVYTTSRQYEDDMLCLPTQGKLLQRSDALKCLTLTRYPAVLCCHVQRLFVDLSTGKTEKCPQHVQFPQLLDLSRYCAYSQKADTSWAAGSLVDSKVQQLGKEKSPVYRLKGVIQHIGTADFGHYVTFREDGRGGWCRISDNTVTPVDFAEVRNCQAYMLFYSSE